jgi:hypothetical protein
MERNPSFSETQRHRLTPAVLSGAGLGIAVMVVMGSVGKLSIIACLAGVVATMLLLLPIRSAIFFYFFYLLIDGAIKVNSNYNPLLHVGQDILLILLAARSCWERDGGGFAKFSRTPHFGLFLMLLSWILIQYINPFGLGILPSVAGTKIYISMLCLFFLVFHHIRREDIPQLLRWLLFLATLESALACAEYLYGQQWMLALHPRYLEMIQEQFGGIFYRPFGTTAVPGGPSMWIMLGAPIAGYFFEKKGSALTDRLLSLIFIVVSAPALVFCQVRVAILLAGATFVLTLLRPSRGLVLRFLGGAAIAAVFAFYVSSRLDTNTTENFRWVSGLSSTQREVLLERTLSLGSKETYLNARGGSWKETMALADITWLGIGLSRVGAASEVWQKRIAADPYFGPRWSFADNLYKAIFTELGIFGLATWLLYVGVVLQTLFKNAFTAPSDVNRSIIWMAAVFGSLMLLSGFGNEGVLYNPVSGIFWTFLALGMREACHVS